MIYLLTEIGLTPGGSSAVHIYTQTTHVRRTTQSTQTVHRTPQFTVALLLHITMTVDICLSVRTLCSV